MMNDWLDRTRRLLGEEALTALAGARVAVLGLGGVGSAAAEGVCRGGVGALLLADCDTVDPTNRNRQLIALRSTEGRPKTAVAADRLADIAPEARLTQLQERLIPENLPLVFDWQPDLVLDAIDTVTTKLALAASCRERGDSAAHLSGHRQPAGPVPAAARHHRGHRRLRLPAGPGATPGVKAPGPVRPAGALLAGAAAGTGGAPRRGKTAAIRRPAAPLYRRPPAS